MKTKCFFPISAILFSLLFASCSEHSLSDIQETQSVHTAAIRAKNTRLVASRVFPFKENRFIRNGRAITSLRVEGNNIIIEERVSILRGIGRRERDGRFGIFDILVNNKLSLRTSVFPTETIIDRQNDDVIKRWVIPVTNNSGLPIQINSVHAQLSQRYILRSMQNTNSPRFVLIPATRFSLSVSRN